MQGSWEEEGGKIKISTYGLDVVQLDWRVVLAVRGHTFVMETRADKKINHATDFFRDRGVFGSCLFGYAAGGFGNV